MPGLQAPTLPQHAAAQSFTFSRRQTCSLVKERLAAPKRRISGAEQQSLPHPSALSSGINRPSVTLNATQFKCELPCAVNTRNRSRQRTAAPLSTGLGSPPVVRSPLPTMASDGRSPSPSRGNTGSSGPSTSAAPHRQPILLATLVLALPADARRSPFGRSWGARSLTFYSDRSKGGRVCSRMAIITTTHRH